MSIEDRVRDMYKYFGSVRAVQAALLKRTDERGNPVYITLPLLMLWCGLIDEAQYLRFVYAVR